MKFYVYLCAWDGGLLGDPLVYERWARGGRKRNVYETVETAALLFIRFEIKKEKKEKESGDQSCPRV
jgi:hypothetical protein